MEVKGKMGEEKKPENVGVINPYALAEVILHRKINWKRVTDPAQLLGKTLGMPYEKLFDPKNNSPLYEGLTLDNTTKTMKRSLISDKETYISKQFAKVGGPTIVWSDPGDFYEEGTELTDPIQGAVGDCYLIAALSSVAWARPYVIAQKTRTTSQVQQGFVDMIEFYSGGKWKKIEVSELLPLSSPSMTFIYARSSEKGEIWPGIYEKAYAKWKNNDAGDRPDILRIAGGDPVRACSELTGLTPYYFWNSNYTAHDIWQKIRQNCISMKTFNPMVAWTYGTAPPGVNYSNAHIAANHAYSIVGWTYNENQEYIVLRNPWGTYEATLNVIGGNWTAWDAPYYGGQGWWRPISFATPDGIFAIRADTFKTHFAGFGFVKTPESP